MPTAGPPAGGLLAVSDGSCSATRRFRAGDDRRFHEGLAWAAQVALFLVLGLLATPSRIEATLSYGIALALVVVLVARPLATFAMTSKREFTGPERALLSWSELVGATPIVFASIAASGGVPQGVPVYDLVFVVAIVSTLLQGLTFEPLARAFGLTSVAPLLPKPLVEFGGPSRLGAELIEYPVAITDGVVGRRVRDLDLPLGVTLALIVRGDECPQLGAECRVATALEPGLTLFRSAAGQLLEQDGHAVHQGLGRFSHWP